MGLLDSIFGGGGYGKTVKKNTVPGRLTYLELKKLIWEIHVYIDSKEKAAILAAFGQRPHYGVHEIKKILWKLLAEHKISRVDYEKFMKKLPEYL